MQWCSFGPRRPRGAEAGSCVSWAQINIIMKFYFGLCQNGFRSAGRRQYSGYLFWGLEAPSLILTGSFRLHVIGIGSRAFICSTVYMVVTGPVWSPWLAILYWTRCLSMNYNELKLVLQGGPYFYNMEGTLRNHQQSAYCQKNGS
jgi:hypothetical protein